MITLTTDALEALDAMIRDEFFVGWRKLLKVAEVAFGASSASGDRNWTDNQSISKYRQKFSELIVRHAVLTRALALSGEFVDAATPLLQLRSASLPEAPVLGLVGALDRAIAEIVATTEATSSGDGVLASRFDQRAEAALLVRVPTGRVWETKTFGARNATLNDTLHAYATTQVAVRRRVLRPRRDDTEPFAKPAIALVLQPLQFDCCELQVVTVAATGVGFHLPVTKTHPHVERLCHQPLTADITVLPEMVVSPDDTDRLRAIFTDDANYFGRVLIAGSGHTRVNDDYCNRSTVLEGGSFVPTADICACHYKKYPFSFVPASLGDESLSSWLSAQPSFAAVNDAKVRLTEHLSRSSGTLRDPLIVFDTHWGRLAVAICRDLLGDNNTLMESLIAARIDYLFLPTASFGGDKDFAAAADRLNSEGIAIFVSNSLQFEKPPQTWRIYVPRRRSMPGPGVTYAVPARETALRSDPVPYVDFKLAAFDALYPSPAHRG